MPRDSVRAHRREGAETTPPRVLLVCVLVVNIEVSPVAARQTFRAREIIYGRPLYLVKHFFLPHVFDTENARRVVPHRGRT